MRARQKIERTLQTPPKPVGGVYAMNNGVCVVDNPAYPYNRSEPRYMVLMPKIEWYTDDLQAAIRLSKNKRLIERERREGEERAGF